MWKLRIDAQQGSTVTTHRFICHMPIHKLRDFTKWFALDHLMKHAMKPEDERSTKKSASSPKKLKSKKFKLPTYDVHLETFVPSQALMHKPYEHKLQSVVRQQNLLSGVQVTLKSE